MYSGKNELDIIFERNLKWKLLKRAFTSAEGIKVLVNIFRFYDATNTGKINKDNWITALISNGLLIGITKEQLSSLFEKYKEENSEMIDYKKFSFDLFFNPSKISLKKVNLNNNNYYSQTESMINSRKFNNNVFLNINETTPISKSQNISNIKNNANNSFPLINTNRNNENIRYDYLNQRINNKYNNNISGIEYSGSHVNSIRNSINYFKSKINSNNGLNYYRFIQQIKSKSLTDDRIPKSFLPIALQNIGVFYTQNELQKFFNALGCDEITINTFSLTKIIELIKDDMNEYRKNIVKDAFNNICNKLNNNNGSISLNTLKQMFKPEMHPEVLNKKRTSNDIYMQFTETLDIFVNLNNIVNNINLDQFIDYYSGISPSIYNDSYFAHIINNVWSNKENNKDNNLSNNNKTNISKSSSMPKIAYDKLNIDNFNINYYQNKKNNLNENNYINNNNINKERNNNSNAKINLPLFYYNRNNNYQKYSTLSKSTNNNENNEYYQNSNNNYSLSPNSKGKYQNQFDNIEQNNLNNIRNSPSYKKINDNLMNRDLNLISSNENTNKNIDITPIIDKLREIFILRGIKSIFYFQRMLYVYDINHTGEISFTNLQNIIQAYNYNFSNEEMNNLFQFYDKENTGYIKYNNLFMEIFGNMNMMRYTLVKKLFDEFPKNQNGNINIDIIKNSFCASKHYDVINGKKTNDEVYGEFLECIEIFREYINNLNGGISRNELTFEEFCDFFGEMSLEIQNDIEFSNFVQSCWKINNDY